MKPLQHEHFNWRNLVLDSDLPFQSKAIALFLSTYMNGQQQIAWPSQATIVGRLGIAKSTLNKYLNILEGNGWITRESGNYGKSTRYFSTYPQEINNILGSTPDGLCPPRGLSSPPHGHGVSTSGTGVVHQRDTNSKYNTQSNSAENNKGKRKRFIPPTLEEIKQEVLEKLYRVDPEAFFFHYEGNGWMVGKNKMKNWRMALASWNKREGQNQKQKGTGFNRLMELAQ